MRVLGAFLCNTLCNFGIGLIVAKFLGPAEYGRFALALVRRLSVRVGAHGTDRRHLEPRRLHPDRLGGHGRPRRRDLTGAPFDRAAIARLQPADPYGTSLRGSKSGSMDC